MITSIRIAAVTLFLGYSVSVCAQGQLVSSETNTNNACDQDYKAYRCTLYENCGKTELENHGMIEEFDKYRSDPSLQDRYLGNTCSQIFPIENGMIIGEPNRVPKAYCSGQINVPPALPLETGLRIPDDNMLHSKAPKPTAEITNSVARLELHRKGGASADDYSLWSTGFVVGRKRARDPSGKEVTLELVATTCHAIEPLAQKASDRWKLHTMEGSELLVDFGERTEYHNPGNENHVTEVVAYSDTKGLDVALIATQLDDPNKRHNIATFSYAGKTNNPIPVQLIGYPDFHHPVDPLIDQSYGPFATFGAAKFMSTGRIGTTGTCCRDKDLYLYDASSTAGQSGSPLVAQSDAADPDRNEAPFNSVIGVHVCCSAFWGEEPLKEPENAYGMNCARVYRGFSNKAVRTEDILKDANLRHALNDYNDHCYICKEGHCYYDERATKPCAP